MQEFKVNDYITLKLEDRKTNIYVAGKLFRQCKYLLLEIPINEITSINEIESIDEAAKRLGHSLENEMNSEHVIPPEVEFWGHCSNLQVWYEYNYDLRLLHSSLAFPLLQKLSDVGDLVARQVLKEELVKRLISGSYSVMDLLINNAYIDFFSNDELWYAIYNLQESKFDKYLYFISAKYYFLEKLMGMGDKSAEELFKKGILQSLSEGYSPIISYFYERGYTDYLSREEFWDIFGTDGLILQKIEQQVRKYKLIDGNKVYQENLNNLEYFKLTNEIYTDSGFMIFTFEQGKVTGMAIFGNERWVAEENHDLYYKDIGYLELEELPDSIGKLKSIRELILRDLGLKKIPRSFENLNQIKFLSLAGNSDIKLSKSLWKLKSLEELDLSMNNIRRISKSVKYLKNLQKLYLYGNRIKSFPLEIIEKLKKIEDICVDLEFAERLDNKTYQYLKDRLSVT